MIRLSIRGPDFRRLAQRVKGVSREIRSELYRGINRATKGLKEDVRKSARDRLPRRGGLNKRVAATKMKTKISSRGKNTGVRIVGTSGYDIGSINRGRVRHLTWGHLPWFNQAVKPGFWTEPLVAGQKPVRREIEQVMRSVAKKIERG